MRKKFFSIFCFVALVSAVSAVNAADLTELESRVKALEAKTGGALGGVELYGSFRPSLRFQSYDGDNSDGDERGDETDLKDNLSRLGVRGSIDLDNDWTAFYRGEWKVNIGDDDGTDFGDARLAYVGFGTPFGEIAFGQRWNTYYNIVGEVTDIYPHSASPFGWDFNGPFRTPSLVTYKHNIGNLNIQAGGRFNGGDGSHRHADEYNIGAGYRFDSLNAYLGVAFRNTQGGNERACFKDSIKVECFEYGDFVSVTRYDFGINGASSYEGFVSGTFPNTDTDWWAVGGSINPTDKLYLAFTYQDGEQDDGAASLGPDPDPDANGRTIVVFDDADKESLDIVASYDFGSGWNGIVGYFDSEDDSKSRGNYDGYNITVKKYLNSNTRVWVEWLSVDQDEDDKYLRRRNGEYTPYYPDETIGIGFAYDFSTK